MSSRSDMARAVRFYAALGFVVAYGGKTAAFTSFRVGEEVVFSTGKNFLLSMMSWP